MPNIVTRLKAAANPRGQQRNPLPRGAFTARAEGDVFVSNPKALRLKAVEIRAVAETVSNPTARRDLLALANRFDRLADQLDVWVAQPNPLGGTQERGKR